MRIIIAITLTIAVLLGGCGSGASYRTLKEIQQSGELRVAINPSGEPFAWSTDYGYQGIEVSFVENLARELDLQAVYTEYTGSEALNAVRYGEADIAIGRLMTTAASSNVSFTLELGQEGVCILALQPDRYDTVGSLEGLTVGLVEDSNAATVFQRNEEAALDWLWYPSLDTAMIGLQAGDIAAVVCIEEEAAALMDASDGQLTACALTNGYRSRYAAAVGGGNLELLQAANALLEAPHPTEVSEDD